MIRVIGGGPAGCAAAIAARALGAAVTVYDPAAFPRHKVCGEFLSAEAVVELDRAGVADEFRRLAPARIDWMEIHLGKAVKRARLPQPAWGLSRYRLDYLLQERARASGCEWRRERITELAPFDVLATGRAGSAPRGTRVFGFKSHLKGDSQGTVELHFGRELYVGINSVEGGHVDVCGLASEGILLQHNFNFDAVCERIGSLPERLAGFSGRPNWLVTGPLIFGPNTVGPQGCYRAGDAFEFIDPFTGSGIARALISGHIAGQSAALGKSPEAAADQIRRTLGTASWCAAQLRAQVEAAWAQWLLPWIPGAWLYWATRPRRIA